MVEDFFIKHITRNGDIQDVWISELLVSIVESEVKIRGKDSFMNKKIKYGIICVFGVGIFLFMCFNCKKYEKKRQIENIKKEEQLETEAAKIVE